MKVVINKCYGGFGLSEEAFKALIKKGWKVTHYNRAGNYKDDNADIVDALGGDTPSKYTPMTGAYGLCGDRNDVSLRTNEDLIEVVEKLGENANGLYAELEVIEIPDGVDFTIEEYDGMEHIAEVHRTWR